MFYNFIGTSILCSGVLILGGGVIKHHILNANIFRYGTDFCVYVNTGNEFDGSDAGASPEEAVSWGKIKLTCKPVKVIRSSFNNINNASTRRWK
jgi:deoxyhypusine synthase